MRRKQFIIDNMMKSRIVDFLKEYYATTCLGIYLGGSHSSTSDKYPHEYSDIDIYVINNVVSNISDDQPCARSITSGLGRKISIYNVNEKFETSVCKNMDVLFKR